MAVRRPRPAHHGAAPAAAPKLRDLLGVAGYARRALGLVWTTSRAITIALAVGSVLLGLMPGAMAWTGKRLVDAVVHAAATGEEAAQHRALVWVGVELGLAIALATTSRVLSILRSLLRAQLGNRINVMILDKALAITTGDAYETWPPPTCTAATQACLAALPAGTTDLSSCGEAVLVRACPR